MIEVRDYLTAELKNSDYVHGTINTWLIPDKQKNQNACQVFEHEREMEAKRKQAGLRLKKQREREEQEIKIAKNQAKLDKREKQ